MSYVIGIDGGGTKSIGILADATGAVIARAEAGPANYHVVGEMETAKVLQTLVDSLLQQGGIELASCQAFCLGMAGLARAIDQEVIRNICHRLGLERNLTLSHDALIGLVGGALKKFGVILIAGTGSIAYGRNQVGQEARAGGWGHILGDEGSGYDIARRALQALFRAYDGRGQQTLLTETLLAKLGMTHPEQLVRWAYTVTKREIANLCPGVFEAAAQADQVAQQIILDAAGELTLAVQVVTSQLGLQSAEFDVVLSGGVFKGQPDFVTQMQTRIIAVAPKAKVHLPTKEPAYGAVLLALEKEM